MNADERAQAILDTVPAAVYSKDLQGRYTYANAFVQELFGADLDTIVGQDDSAFFDLERSNVLRVNDEEVMRTGESISREELDVVKDTGEQRVYWTVKSPLRNDEGVIVGMCGISIDITER